MTALVWMLTWLPHVVSAMSEIPQPVNVTLSSISFIHLLRWDPGPGTPRNAYYNVKVHAERGNSWEPVVGCEHIVDPLVCNLTEAFPDTRQPYYTSVTALWGTRTSQPASVPVFVPIRDTHLDLPLLTVSPCGRFLCVDLQPPVENLRKHYDSLEYQLRIRSSSPDRAQSFKKTKSLKGEVLKDLAAGQQYCVSVSFSDSLVPRTSNYSQPQCPITHPIYTADPVISVMLCLLVLVVLVFLGLLGRSGFICLKETQPPVLTSIQHQEEMLAAVPCQAPLISPVHIDPTPPSTGENGSDCTVSDDNDGETEVESKGRERDGYELRIAANPLSASSSSSSSSLSSPFISGSGLLPHSNPNSSTVFLPSDFITFGFDRTHSHLSPLSTDAPSMAGLDHALTTFMASHSASPPESDQRASGLHPHTDTFDTVTLAGIKPEEEEEEAGERSSRDVNLFSLTFGELEEEEEEKQGLEMPDREDSTHNTVPLLPPQCRDAEEVAMETVSTFVEEEEKEEEEEEECSGYMRR